MSNVFNVRRHYLHCMFEASGFLLQIFFPVPMRSQSWNLRSLRRILNFLHSAHFGFEIFLKEHSHVHKSPTLSRDNYIITTLIESKCQTYAAKQQRVLNFELVVRDQFFSVILVAYNQFKIQRPLLLGGVNEKSELM